MSPAPSFAASEAPSAPASNTNVGFGSLHPPAPQISATIDANTKVTNLGFRLSFDGIDMQQKLDNAAWLVN